MPLFFKKPLFPSHKLSSLLAFLAFFLSVSGAYHGAWGAAPAGLAPSLSTIAQLSDTLGVQLAAQGQLLAAEPLLVRAKTAQPNVALYHLHYGIVEEALDRSSAAQMAYKRALQLDPTLLQAAYNLGLLLDKQGKPAAGLPYLNKALLLKPESGLLHYDIGVLYAKLGQFAQSAEHSKQALLKGKPFAEAYNNYGFALANLKRYPEALTMINKALALKPNSAAILDSKGFALHGMGEYPQAIVWYRKAIQADPTLPDLYLHLAEALEKAPEKAPQKIAANPANASHTAQTLTATILAYETFMQLSPPNSQAAKQLAVQTRLTRLRQQLAATTPTTGNPTTAATPANLKQAAAKAEPMILRQPLVMNVLSNESATGPGVAPTVYLNPAVFSRRFTEPALGIKPGTPFKNKSLLSQPLVKYNFSSPVTP